MVTYEPEDARASTWSRFRDYPIVGYFEEIFVLVVRNWLLFTVFLLFILMIADAFGRSFGLPHLFRNDPAILEDHGLVGYLQTALTSSPGIWGHVATTLLLITILIGVAVKEILHDQERTLSRSIVIRTVIKYGLFFSALQIGAVICRDFRQSETLPVMALEVTEAVVGVAVAYILALGSIFLMSKLYSLAYKKWGRRPIGQRSTRILKTMTVQSLWHNPSDDAPWIVLYFITGVLIVATPFLYFDVVVPGVALCILVILVVTAYFALGSIRPLFRNPLILGFLLIYSSCNYDPFKVQLPDFTIASHDGADVNLYDCPLRIGTWRDGSQHREFDCDSLGKPAAMAAQTRSLSRPAVKGKDPKAAGEVVKGGGSLDHDTCIMMEAWRARNTGKKLTRDQLEKRCSQSGSWRTRNLLAPDPSLQPDQGQKPKLVVVTAAGGAYRAGFWTALVLDELIARSQAGNSLEHLADNIKLLTGASGGMVASAYFAALSSDTNWSAPGAPSIMQRLLHDIERSRNAAVDEKEAPGKFKTSFPINRDSLGPIAQQTLQRDVMRTIFWPFLPKSLLAWENWHDRGLVLEQQWATLNRTFGELRDGWLDGAVPGLILSPMIADTGQPLMISNVSIRQALNRSEKAAVDLFGMFPEMLDRMKVQTAVRMNASFPYISPAVSLPTKPKMRIVDAGYYDNYGVNTAITWLSQQGMAEYLKETTSGVIIIQIRAYSTEPPSANGPDQPDLAYLPEWLTSPIKGVSQARNSSMLFRNTKELKLLSSQFCEGFVQTVAFENTLEERDISMSWYLRQDELDKMAKELAPPSPEKFNTRVFQDLEAIWQSNQTGHESCRDMPANRMAAGNVQ